MMSKSEIDTNVLIHLYEVNDLTKLSQAADILLLRPVVSAQVISEFLNVLQRIIPGNKKLVLSDAVRLLKDCPIAPVTHATLNLAAYLLARYDFQLFDSIVVAAALEADCTTLYSADFQHNQLIEKRLRIINPFL